MNKLNRKKIIIALLVIFAFICLTQALNFFFQRIIYPREYEGLVSAYSEKYGVPEYIVYSVIKAESDFEADAVSEKGASGLMQLMPETHAWLAEMRGEAAGDVFDPEENIKNGVYYLSLLYDRYGDWTLVFCAYNAGMGNVDKWLQAESFQIRFTETKYYVNKLQVVTDKYLRLYYR